MTTTDLPQKPMPPKGCGYTLLIILAILAIVGGIKDGCSQEIPNCSSYTSGPCRFTSGSSGSGLQVAVTYDTQTWWSYPGTGNVFPRMMEHHGLRNGLPLDTGNLWFADYENGQIMTMTGTPTPPSFPPVADHTLGNIQILWNNPPTAALIVGVNPLMRKIRSVYLETGLNKITCPIYEYYMCFPQGYQSFLIHEQ